MEEESWGQELHCCFAIWSHVVSEGLGRRKKYKTTAMRRDVGSFFHPSVSYTKAFCKVGGCNLMRT